jgi:hypothetical protein
MECLLVAKVLKGERMRRSNAKLRWVAVTLAGILLTGAWVVVCRVDLPTVLAAQNSQNPPPQNQASPDLPPEPPPFGHEVDTKTVEQVQIQRAQNAEWQKQLTQDTAKLLQLAKQLKEEVDKSDGNTLSVDVIKKATEIDKLAKSVKSAASFASQKQN